MPLGKRILILGAGNKPSGNAVNHDITKHRPEIDIAWDLNDLPWPWGDSMFDSITAWAVLEHLYHDVLRSMNEIWRIGAPGCIANIKLPYWRSEVSHNDLTHHWFVGLNCFDQLDPSTRRGSEYAFYTPCEWTILSCALNKGGTSALNKGGTSVLAKLKSLKGAK